MDMPKLTQESDQNATLSVLLDCTDSLFLSKVSNVAVKTLLKLSRNRGTENSDVKLLIRIIKKLSDNYTTDTDKNVIKAKQLLEQVQQSYQVHGRLFGFLYFGMELLRSHASWLSAVFLEGTNEDARWASQFFFDRFEYVLGLEKDLNFQSLKDEIDKFGTTTKNEEFDNMPKLLKDQLYNHYLLIHTALKGNFNQLHEEFGKCENVKADLDNYIQLYTSKVATSTKSDATTQGSTSQTNPTVTATPATGQMRLTAPAGSPANAEAKEAQAETSKSAPGSSQDQKTSSLVTSHVYPNQADSGSQISVGTQQPRDTQEDVPTNISTMLTDSVRCNRAPPPLSEKFQEEQWYSSGDPQTRKLVRVEVSIKEDTQGHFTKVITENCWSDTGENIKAYITESWYLITKPRMVLAWKLIDLLKKTIKPRKIFLPEDHKRGESIRFVREQAVDTGGESSLVIHFTDDEQFIVGPEHIKHSE